MDKILEQYRESVCKYAAEGKDYLFHNEGEDHAKIIFGSIFRNAQKEIRIFAKDLCNEVVNSDEYKNALYKFIDRDDTKLKILVTEADKDKILKEGTIFRLLYLHPGYDRKDIEIKCTNGKTFKQDGNIVHFCTADGKMYRLETDVDKRHAICNFNDANSAHFFENLFDEQFDKIEDDVNLREVFGY